MNKLESDMEFNAGLRGLLVDIEIRLGEAVLDSPYPNNVNARKLLKQIDTLKERWGIK